MCWIGKNIKHKAKRNITVYKIVNNCSGSGIRSYFQRYEWEIGKIHLSKFKIILLSQNCRNYIKIREGLHSYSNKCQIDFRKYCYDIGITDKKHKYNFCYYLKSSKLCKLTCVIPKGAVYYYNDEGEYVSNKLIPVKIDLLNNE